MFVQKNIGAIWRMKNGLGVIELQAWKAVATTPQDVIWRADMCRQT
jgi:hypothetical protein